MNVPENMTLQATIDQGDKKPEVTPVQALAEWFSWPGRVAVLAAVLLAPWMFGSYGPWAQRLLTFLLLVGVGFWWFESAVTRNRTQVIPYMAVLLILGLLIGFLQTLALPDWLANIFVGRQAELYEQFVPGGEAAARISLDVESTYEQIRLLVICLAALLLGSRYFRQPRDTFLLLSACTINGALIAFFGLIQKLTSDPGTIFWTIKLHAGGVPFGPFVNRNNSAGYLLLCLACALGLCALVMSERKTSGPVQMVSKEMPFWRQFYYHLLYFLAELTATKIAVLIGIVLIASGVVATLSRGGVTSLIIGSMLTLGMYGLARRPKYTGFILIPLLGFVFALTGWLNFSDGLMKRFERTDMASFSTERRLQNWKDTWPVVKEMGWFGAGLGSYASVHRLYRSDDEQQLFAHAENQFFQGLVEAGWPGLILFCFAWWLLYHYSSTCLSRGVSPATIAVGVVGVFLVASQIPAALVDFGLYIPANAILLAVLVGFVAFHTHSFTGRLKRKTWLRFEAPNVLLQGGLLAMFALGFMTLLQHHRGVCQAHVMDVRLEKVDGKTLGLEATDELIKQVTETSKRAPSSKAMNYLGKLWVHRARLQFLASIKEDADFDTAMEGKTAKERETIEENLWKLTSVPRMQENAYFLKRDISPFQARRFLNSEFIRDNLPWARSYFDYSRRRRPLQALVHLEVGKLSGVLDHGRGIGDVDIERAISLAPSNSQFRKTAGIYYLQSGNIDQAAVHLREHLRLHPRGFTETMNLVTGRASRTVAPVSERVIYEQILPDSADMLYAYAQRYLEPESAVRAVVLEKADQLVGVPVAGDLASSSLKAKIKLAQGDVSATIKYLKLAIISRPDDVKTRFSLAKLLQKVGQLEEAREQVNHLLRLKPRDRNYNRLAKKIRDELRQSDKRRLPLP